MQQLRTSLKKMENQESKENINESANILKDSWAIRPCDVYQDEYDDCTSIKARFHQYFINGENTDCSQWLTDYKNCVRFENSNGNNVEAGAAVIKSEEIRRRSRLKAHFDNDTWQKRKQPPADWSKPLPEWFAKRNENTFLEIKQKETDGREVPTENAKSFCVVM